MNKQWFWLPGYLFGLITDREGESNKLLLNVGKLLLDYIRRHFLKTVFFIVIVVGSSYPTRKLRISNRLITLRLYQISWKSISLFKSWHCEVQDLLPFLVVYFTALSDLDYIASNGRVTATRWTIKDSEGNDYSLSEVQLRKLLGGAAKKHEKTAGRAGRDSPPSTP